MNGVNMEITSTNAPMNKSLIFYDCVSFKNCADSTRPAGLRSNQVELLLNNVELSSWITPCCFLRCRWFDPVRLSQSAHQLFVKCKSFIIEFKSVKILFSLPPCSW